MADLFALPEGKRRQRLCPGQLPVVHSIKAKMLREQEIDPREKNFRIRLGFEPKTF